jgi:hypothetical protein
MAKFSTITTFISLISSDPAQLLATILDAYCLSDLEVFYGTSDK